MVDAMLGPAVQLLTPEGERVDHPDFDVSLTDAELRSLYRHMVLVRRMDAEATALQRQGEIGLWASSLGQEAAQVGSAWALRATDYAFPTYRDHGVTWVRGVPPMEVLAMFRGITNGGWDPLARRCSLYTIVIGNQVLHAAGYAMGVQLDGADEAVIAYFGDGATDEGDVSEAFVMGADFQLPLVYFCENNQWAISSPRERFHRTPLYQRAAGFGFPGLRVDGNDILAVIAVTRMALDRARAGGGPTMIEAFTYRMGAHTTSDDPTRYRHAEDLEVWRLRDPIERLKVFMARNGIADRVYFDQIDDEASDLAVHVRDGVRAMTAPPPETMFDHVYAEPYEPLVRQRADFLAYEESFLHEGAEAGGGA